MFLKKEVILLGVLLSLRIIFTIVQILIDYKILSGQYSVNFMDISEVFTYPILILIIYIAVKYHAIQKIRGKEDNQDGNE